MIDDLPWKEIAYKYMKEGAERRASEMRAWLKRSHINAENAKAKPDNPVHDEIIRIGKSVASTHENHEITGIVHRRIDERLSRQRVRQVLQQAGVIKKR